MVDAHQDRLRTLLLAITLGLTTLAFIIAKTGRDALFFQGSGGLLQLPPVYINIACASLPLALIFVKAMKVWGARPARIAILSLGTYRHSSLSERGELIIDISSFSSSTEVRKLL